MGVISYFIDQVERLEAYDADDNFVFPAIPKQEFKAIKIVGRNDTHIKVELEESAQKSGRNMDFSFAYSNIVVADIVANGGGPANGYPTITNISTMVDWLRYAIWGKGAGGAGGGAIESFEIKNDTYHSLELVDGDSTTFNIQLMKAGYREVAFENRDQVVIDLPDDFPPPMVIALREADGGELEQFQYGTYILEPSTNTLTITWVGLETGKLVLR